MDDPRILRNALTAIEDAVYVAIEAGATDEQIDDHVETAKQWSRSR